MDNRIVEHELCPVVVATVDPSVALRLDPDEVEAAEWTTWDGATASAPHEAPHTLSPWAVEQVRELDRLGAHLQLARTRPTPGGRSTRSPGAPAREALTVAVTSIRSSPCATPVEPRARRVHVAGPQSSRPWTPRSRR